jgi:putative FmdB family regulatory protein
MSKFMFFDFRCGECNYKFEGFVKPDVLTERCPECGGDAKRTISCPTIALDGCDPAFPTAWDKWASDKEKRYKEQKKEVADHGSQGPEEY